MLVSGGLLGNYRIEGELGRGGMGVVFRARDERLERDVAIKALPEALKNDADRLDRFRREARTVAQLSHPHIAQIHHLIEQDGQTFLVLELVKGRSLAEVLEHGKLDEATALRLAAQIAGALEAAHAKGVIHRDLKPGNVMIAEDGSARVLDFGLAVMRSNASPWVGDETIGPGGSTGDKVVGTPGYMAPEQARGEMIDQRADLFSFGCLLYELLARRPAFEGRTHAARLTSTLTMEPDLRLTKAPPAVISMLEACLVKSPHRRLASAAEARRILEAALAPEASRVQPPAEAPEQHPTNLRPAADQFIGHVDDLRELGEIVQQTRLVTLTGAGGCGKTRLASELGQRILERFPGGVWMVELAAVGTPDLLVQAVASALGVKEEPLKDGIAQRLAKEPALVILDNCEHLLDEASSFVSWLLGAASNVRLLVTSREPLSVAGERVWRIRNLSLPPASAIRSSGSRSGSGSSRSSVGSSGSAVRSGGGSGSSSGSGSAIDIEGLLASESVALFVDRARQVQPGFELTPHNAGAVASVCARLDGIPLAIELAAARVKVLPPEQLDEKLNDRFRLLRAGRGRTERHQTLRAALDWSYQLLHEDGRNALRALSVFYDGCTLEAATHVLAGPEGDEFETLDLLTNLVDKSLVIAGDRQGTARYRLLESVRIFALEELAAAGDAEAAQERHLEFFEKMALAAGERYATLTAEDLDGLDNDHENLIEAIRFALGDRSHVRRGLAMCFALRSFWFRRVHVAVKRLMYRLGYEARGAADSPEEYGNICWLYGQERLDTGETEIARKLFEEAREIGARNKLPEVEMMAVGMLSRLSIHAGELERALQLRRRVLDLSRQLGDRTREAQSHFFHAIILSYLGRHSEAEEACIEAQSIWQSMGAQVRVGEALSEQAVAVTRGGDPLRACTLLVRSLKESRIGGSSNAELNAVDLAGEIADGLGEHDKAARWSGFTLSIKNRNAIQQPAPERAIEQAFRARLKSALGEQEYARLYHEGEMLDQATAVAEVEAWLNERVAAAQSEPARLP